jgi:high-affinity iron transporter
LSTLFFSYLLSLREGIEAALVIGIMLGALRQLRRMDCAHVVWTGVVSAVAASAVGAVLLHLLGWSLHGAAEEIFEGVMLFTAAGLLTWMIFWMSRQSHRLKGDLEAGLRKAMCSPGHRGVFMLTFVAVAREGVELALFLTAAGVDSNGPQTLGGAFLGLATAALLGWSLFTSTARLNLRRFFQVTGVMLILFAAGMVATGVHEFNELGWIPALVDPVWNSHAVLSEQSAVGALLKGLFGYTSSPSLAAALAYVVYLLAILAGIRFSKTTSVRHSAAPAAPGNRPGLVAAGGVPASKPAEQNIGAAQA